MHNVRIVKCPCCDAEMVQRKHWEWRFPWFRSVWTTSSIARTEEEKQLQSYALSWEGWYP
jgi:hypothetical protein